MDELLCKEYATGLRHRNRGGAEVLEKEAAELAFAEAESAGQVFYAVVRSVESAFGDKGERARDGV
jgi:hypothetical protein